MQTGQSVLLSHFSESALVNTAGKITSEFASHSDHMICLLLIICKKVKLKCQHPNFHVI